MTQIRKRQNYIHYYSQCWFNIVLLSKTLKEGWANLSELMTGSDLLLLQVLFDILWLIWNSHIIMVSGSFSFLLLISVKAGLTSAAKYCPVARCLKRYKLFQWPAPPLQGSWCTTYNQIKNSLRYTSFRFGIYNWLSLNTHFHLPQCIGASSRCSRLTQRCT